jgi:hypothetical protein
VRRDITASGLITAAIRRPYSAPKTRYAERATGPQEYAALRRWAYPRSYAATTARPAIGIPTTAKSSMPSASATLTRSLATDDIVRHAEMVDGTGTGPAILPANMIDIERRAARSRSPPATAPGSTRRSMSTCHARVLSRSFSSRCTTPERPQPAGSRISVRCRTADAGPVASAVRRRPTRRTGPHTPLRCDTRRLRSCGWKSTTWRSKCWARTNR